VLCYAFFYPVEVYCVGRSYSAFSVTGVEAPVFI